MTSVQHESYLQAMVNAGIYQTKQRLHFYTNNLFQNIDLTNKNFLDIGGGLGLFSFYAATEGVTQAICLEPELEGSTQQITNQFELVKADLKLDNVFLDRSTIQQFETDMLFDVILLHNSINHLNEPACIALLDSREAQEIYRNLLKRIYTFARDGATLIICDCARQSFYPMVNVRNPFAKTIEWHKHQNPEVWINLLSQVGFSQPRLRWTSPSRLGNLGRVFLSNKLAAQFFTSHFCLTMRKL